MHGPLIKGYLVNSNECLMKSNRWADPGQNKHNPRSKQTFLWEVRRDGSSLHCFLETQNSDEAWRQGPARGSQEDHRAPMNQVVERKYQGLRLVGAWALWPGREAKLLRLKEESVASVTWSHPEGHFFTKCLFSRMSFFTESQGKKETGSHLAHVFQISQ